VLHAFYEGAIFVNIAGTCSRAPGRFSGATAFQHENRPCDDEAECADGKRCRVSHEDAGCGCHRWDPPESQEKAWLSRPAIEDHKQAECDTRKRHEEH
jgi:hypothetical protein